MKKAITLNIPEPCNENWSSMTPVQQGKFCKSCNKTVYDFTNKNDEQIIELFESKGKVCGRFQKNQLNRSLIYSRKESNSFRTLIASGIFGFLSLFHHEIKAQEKPKTIQRDTEKFSIKGKQSVSILQEKLISGTVSDEESYPLPGANVIIKGTTIGTQTDFDGNFKLKAKKGQVLQISFIGYETKEVIVSNSAEYNIKVNLSAEVLGELVVVGYPIYDSEYEYLPTNEELEEKRKLRKLSTKNYFKFYKRKLKEKKALKRAKRDSIRKTKPK